MADPGDFALHRPQRCAQPLILEPRIVKGQILVAVIGQLVPCRVQRPAMLAVKHLQRLAQTMTLGQQFKKNRPRRPSFVQRDHANQSTLCATHKQGTGCGNMPCGALRTPVAALCERRNLFRHPSPHPHRPWPEKSRSGVPAAYLGTTSGGDAASTLFHRAPAVRKPLLRKGFAPWRALFSPTRLRRR